MHAGISSPDGPASHALADENQARLVGLKAMGLIAFFLLIYWIGTAISLMRSLFTLDSYGQMPISIILPTAGLSGALVLALVGVLLGISDRPGGMRVALLGVVSVLVVQVTKLVMPLDGDARGLASPLLMLLVCLPTVLAIALLWQRMRGWTYAVISGEYGGLVFFFGLGTSALLTSYLVHLLMTGRFTLHEGLPMLAVVVVSVLVLLTLVIATMVCVRRPLVLASICVPVLGLFLCFGMTTKAALPTLPGQMLEVAFALVGGGVLLVGNLVNAAAVQRERATRRRPRDDDGTDGDAWRAADPLPTALPAGPIPLAYHAAKPLAQDRAIRSVVLKLVLAYVAICLIAMSLVLTHLDTFSFVVRLLSPRYMHQVLGPLLMFATGAMLVAAINGANRFIVRSAVLLVVAGVLDGVVGPVLLGFASLQTVTWMVPIGVAALALYGVREARRGAPLPGPSVGAVALWGTAIFAVLAIASIGPLFVTAMQLPGMLPAAYAIAGVVIIGVLIVGRVLAPTPDGHRNAIILLGVVGVVVLATRVSRLLEGRPTTVWIFVLAGAIAPFVLLIGLNWIARRVSMARG